MGRVQPFRRFLILLLCAVLTTTAVACNPPPVDTTPTSAPTAPAEDTPTTAPTEKPMEMVATATGTMVPAPSNFDFKDKKLYGLGTGGGADAEIIKKTMMELYGVELVKIEYTSETVAEVLQSRITAGERTDVMGYALYPDYAFQGLVQPVDGLIDYTLDITKRNAASYEDYKYGGKHYALVMDSIATSNVFYNTKFFTDNNLTTPREYYEKGEWTWDTMLDLAKKLTVDENKDGTPEIYGLTSCNWHTARLAYTTGQNVIRVEDGKFVSNIDNPAYARVFQYMFDLFYSSKVCDPNREVSYTQGKFSRGETPMLMISSWMGINGLYLAKIKNKDLLAYVPYPKDPQADDYYVAGTNTMFMLPAGSQNVDAAKAWIYSASLYYFEQNVPGTPGYLAKLKDAKGNVPNLTDEIYAKYAAWYAEYNQLKKVPELYNSLIDVDNQLFVGMIGSAADPTQLTYQQVVALQEPILNDKLTSMQK